MYDVYVDENVDQYAECHTGEEEHSKLTRNV